MLPVEQPHSALPHPLVLSVSVSVPVVDLCRRGGGGGSLVVPPLILIDLFRDVRMTGFSRRASFF